MLTQYASSGLSSIMSRQPAGPEEDLSASSPLRETTADFAEEYRAIAAVFRAFAVETIVSEIREELFMLAEGFEQLATKPGRTTTSQTPPFSTDNQSFSAPSSGDA